MGKRAILFVVAGVLVGAAMLDLLARTYPAWKVASTEPIAALRGTS